MTRRYGVEGGRPRRSDVGDWARRAQSIGEWPGVSFTCLEGLVGTEEWVGGGARVDVPGARLGTGRERFGEGACGGRRDELLLETGARVGMRRAFIAGFGGGAMTAGERLPDDEGGGGGGGGMRSDAVGALIACVGCRGRGERGIWPESLGGGMAGLVGCEVEGDGEGEGEGRGSDSEKLGMAWAGFVVHAAALGVAWPSPSLSPSL